MSSSSGRRDSGVSSLSIARSGYESNRRRGSDTARKDRSNILKAYLMDVGCTKLRGARKRRKNEDGEYEGGKIDWDSEWVQEQLVIPTKEFKAIRLDYERQSREKKLTDATIERDWVSTGGSRIPKAKMLKNYYPTNLILHRFFDLMHGRMLNNHPVNPRIEEQMQSINPFLKSRPLALYLPDNGQGQLAIYRGHVSRADPMVMAYACGSDMLEVDGRYHFHEQRSVIARPTIQPINYFDDVLVKGVGCRLRSNEDIAALWYSAFGKGTSSDDTGPKEVEIDLFLSCFSEVFRPTLRYLFLAPFDNKQTVTLDEFAAFLIWCSNLAENSNMTSVQDQLVTLVAELRSTSSNASSSAARGSGVPLGRDNIVLYIAGSKPRQLKKPGDYYLRISSTQPGCIVLEYVPELASLDAYGQLQPIASHFFFHVTANPEMSCYFSDQNESFASITSLILKHMGMDTWAKLRQCCSARLAKDGAILSLGSFSGLLEGKVVATGTSPTTTAAEVALSPAKRTASYASSNQVINGAGSLSTLSSSFPRRQQQAVPSAQPPRQSPVKVHLQHHQQHQQLHHVDLSHPHHNEHHAYPHPQHQQHQQQEHQQQHFYHLHQAQPSSTPVVAPTGLRPSTSFGRQQRGRGGSTDLHGSIDLHGSRRGRGGSADLHGSFLLPTGSNSFLGPGFSSLDLAHSFGMGAPSWKSEHHHTTTPTTAITTTSNNSHTSMLPVTVTTTSLSNNAAILINNNNVSNDHHQQQHQLGGLTLGQQQQQQQQQGGAGGAALPVVNPSMDPPYYTRSAASSGRLQGDVGDDPFPIQDFLVSSTSSFGSLGLSSLANSTTSPGQQGDNNRFFAVDQIMSGVNLLAMHSPHQPPPSRLQGGRAPPTLLSPATGSSAFSGSGAITSSSSSGPMSSLSGGIESSSGEMSSNASSRKRRRGGSFVIKGEY